MKILTFIIEQSTALRDLSLIIFGFFGAYLLWSRTRSTARQADAARSQSATAENARLYALIDKTIEQLESTSAGQRIYALQKMGDIIQKPQLSWVISSIITSFIQSELRKRTEIEDRYAPDIFRSLEILSNHISSDAEFDEGWLNFIDLRRTNFSGIGLSDLYFLQADFSFSNFSDSKFNMTTMKNCYFSESRFASASFESVTFVKCFLKGAGFDGAVFSNTRFINCDYDSASFANAETQPLIIDEGNLLPGLGPR